MKKTRILLMAAIAVLIVGCGDDTGVTPSVTPEPQLMYLDETIIIDQSDWILATTIEGDVAEFDISQDPLYLDSSFNDIEFRTSSLDSREIPNWSWNTRTESWTQFTPQDSPLFIIHPIVSCHSNPLSHEHLTAYEFVDSNGIVKLKSSLGAEFLEPDWGCLEAVRLARLHPYYFALPVHLPGGYKPQQVAFDGTNLWAFGDTPPAIYKMSSEGETLKQFNLVSGGLKDIAFDGNSLWILAVDEVVKMNTDGEIIAQVAFDTRSFHALTAGDGRLWLCAHSQDSDYLIGYDSDSLVQVGALYPTEILTVEGISDISQLGFHNGKLVLLGGGKLIELSDSLAPAREFNLPVTRSFDISFWSDTVWIMHHGPQQGWGSSPVLSRFAVR